MRRAVALLLLTVIAPGGAQAVAGPRRLGRIVVRTWFGLLAVIAAIGAGWFVAPGTVLGLLASPRVLDLVTVTCYALAGLYVLLLAHAWGLGRPGELPQRARTGVAVLTAVLMLGTAVPLVGIARRSWAAADLIAGVFTGRHASVAVDGRYNVLLLGGDAGPDRIGTRPDSITLVSIDAGTGRSVMYSLPRNLENVPFAPGTAAARALPNGYSCGDACLLNAVYSWGAEHRDLFPGSADPGAEAMKQAAQGITGLTVNYYVLIDLKGFAQLIDTMGGIELRVGTVVPIGGGTSPVSGYIQPGRQRLDGYHALWFARSRTGASDYTRMARQRCVMDAMLRQLDPATVLADFRDIAAAGGQVVSTDVPVAQLPAFVELARGAKAQKVTGVQFVPPLVDPAYPDFTQIRQVVADTLGGRSSTGPTGTASPGAGNTGNTGRDVGTATGPAQATSTTTASAAVDVGAVCSAT